MWRRVVVIMLTLLLLSPDSGEAALFRWSEAARIKGRRLGIVFVGDPYKSYASINLDFKRRKPIDRTRLDKLGMTNAMLSEGTIVEKGDEARFYRRLLSQSLKPGYILIELDYFPLTHIGTTFFEGEDSRFRLVSSSYDQFLSYTFFLGEILPFFTRMPGQRQKQKPAQTGWAMAGFLFTLSNWRVSQNVAYRDNWYKIQWKLMAQNSTGSRTMVWRVAAGFTFHSHDRFQNSLALDIGRTRIDRSFNGWSLFRNASLTYTGEMPVDGSVDRDSLWDFFRLHRLTYGKHFPMKWTKSSMLHINVGFSWERFKLFNPTRFESNFQIILGPNLSF